MCPIQDSITSQVTRVIYTSHGFEVLAKLITLVQKRGLSSQLDTLRSLCALSQGDKEGLDKFMSSMRTKDIALNGLAVDQLIPLFALVSMDKEHCVWTLFRYQSGDPLVVNGSLESLQGLILEEDERC